MFPILSDGVAVYPYTRLPGSDRYSFLQMQRAAAEDAVYAGSWQPVYGGALPDEEATATARRELREETGLIPLKLHLIEYMETFYFRPRNAVMMLPVFAAEIEPEAPVVLNREHTGYRWVEESEVHTLFMWRSQRDAIAVILDTLRNRIDSLEWLEV